MQETGVMKKKENLRIEIQKQVEEYLAKGGEITQVDFGVMNPSKKISYNNWADNAQD